MKMNKLITFAAVAAVAASTMSANAARAAMESRSDERSSGVVPLAFSSARELRKAVASLLVQAARRVNAVYEINPENAAAAAAITKVAALVEEYKLVASQSKGKKKEEPEPAPAPEASAS